MPTISSSPGDDYLRRLIAMLILYAAIVFALTHFSSCSTTRTVDITQEQAALYQSITNEGQIYEHTIDSLTTLLHSKDSIITTLDTRSNSIVRDTVIVHDSISSSTTTDSLGHRTTIIYRYHNVFRDRFTLNTETTTSLYQQNHSSDILVRSMQSCIDSTLFRLSDTTSVLLSTTKECTVTKTKHKSFEDILFIVIFLLVVTITCYYIIKVSEDNV